MTFNDLERQAFAMFMEGIPLKDISEELDININTLKFWVYNGKSYFPPWNSLSSPDASRKYYIKKEADRDFVESALEIKGLIFDSMRPLAVDLCLKGDYTKIEQLRSLWALYREIEASMIPKDYKVEIKDEKEEEIEADSVEIPVLDSEPEVVKGPEELKNVNSIDEFIDWIDGN